MKTVKAGILFFILLSASGSKAFAEIAFDLHEQHFSKSIAGEYEGARYELPKSFVSTNLKYDNGYYITENSSGYFNVEVKNPSDNWSVSIDTFYRFSINYKRTRTIKITSENGESVMVSFKYNDTKFNDEKVYGETTSTRVTTSLRKNGNDIELIINGEKAGSVARPSFSKLKYIELQLIQEGSSFDRLNSLNIGSK